MALRGRVPAPPATGSDPVASTTLGRVSRLQLAPVAQGLSDFEAKVVTARLGADGILWELRGIVDSMYPLGGIDVLVPVTELEAARQSLLGQAPIGEAASVTAPRRGADEPVVAAAGDAGARPPPRAGPAAPRRWWLTVAVILGVATFSATRIVAAIVWLQEDRRDDCSPRAAAEGLTAGCRP
jgi:hypothetical protein